MKRKILSSVLVASLLMTGCGKESKYSSEDEKLQVYSTNVYRAVHQNVLDGTKEPKEFKEAIPYIEAYKKDIDRSRLSEPKQKIYDEIVDALDDYSTFIDAAKANDEEMYHEAIVGQNAKLPVRVEKYFPDDRELDDYISVEDLRD